uniref:Uncharacterized protein n=1 Tax=Anguilla anguilla TaxID=7936 RepID=A0A0E9V5N2_ANGAN
MFACVVRYWWLC